MNFSLGEEDRLWQEPEKESRPNILRYGIFAVFLLGVLIGLWFLISPSHQGHNTADLPLVKADPEPYKMKAENQGVPSVKHQDKLVYGRIRSDKAEPVAEHILPDPELPMPELKEDAAPLKMVEQYAPQDVDPGKIVEVTEDALESAALTSIADLIDEGESAPKVPEKNVSKGKVYIQLGSLKSYDQAESEWKRLSKKHADELGKYEPVIQKVDLGADQGIYYRLRTGPFEDTEKASAICESLKGQKVGCVVVK